MQSQILKSEKHFKQAFHQGLLNLISGPQSAGTFILVLANFLQHPQLYTQHQSAIEVAYSKLLLSYQQCDKLNIPIDEPADDADVMRSIMKTGLDNIHVSECRIVDKDNGHWQVAFNQLRSLRPERMSHCHNESIDHEFNENDFHFNKAFLNKEVFIEQVFNNRKISLLYNKFPFCDYHGILVVDRDKQYKQYLFEDVFNYIWQFYSQLIEIIPDLILSYNSLSAGASVNHLHFQTCISQQLFSVDSARWLHNGGNIQYPAECIVFNDVAEAWHYLENLQNNNNPFNLTFINNKLYCLPRVLFPEMTGPVKQIGWFEMAGSYSVSDMNTFNQHSDSQIRETLESVSLRNIRGVIR